MCHYPLNLGMIDMWKKAGFTLIEMSLALVIMGIIGVVIGRVMLQSYQMFTTMQNITEADNQAFLALERIVNDIHTMRSPVDITTMAASQLSFVDQSGVSIQFQLSGTTLSRNSQTLATGVQSLVFTYKNNTGATTATASQVRYIAIDLTTVHGTMTAAFSTQAAIRGIA